MYSKDNNFIIIPLLAIQKYLYILLIMVDGRYRKFIVLYFDCMHFLRNSLVSTYTPSRDPLPPSAILSRPRVSRKIDNVSGGS